MIPVITFSANLATLIILTLGGKFIISHVMSIGDFASFNSYLVILIFPIILIGIMSNFIAQAQGSYDRIYAVLSSPEAKKEGTLIQSLKGGIEIENLSLNFGQKQTLKNISLKFEPGSKVEIIGQTR